MRMSIDYRSDGLCSGFGYFCLLLRQSFKASVVLSPFKDFMKQRDIAHTVFQDVLSLFNEFVRALDCKERLD